MEPINCDSDIEWTLLLDRYVFLKSLPGRLKGIWNFPLSQPTIPKSPRVIISGDIGSGKTTLVSSFGKTVAVKEPISEILNYGGSSLFATTNFMFSAAFVQSMRFLIGNSEFKILERCIIDTLIFARSRFPNVPETQVQDLLYWFALQLIEIEQKYDLFFVFLDCDPAMSFRRMKHRGYNLDVNIDKTFHHEINALHKTYFSENPSNFSVQTIDTTLLSSSEVKDRVCKVLKVWKIIY